MGLFDAIGRKLGLGALGGAAVGGVLNTAFVYSGYKTDRAKGHGPVFSIAQSIASTVLLNEFMWPSIALSILPLIPIMHEKMTQAVGGMQRNMIPMSPYGRPDTQIAQTSRQRSMQAISQARMSARNAMGNEAGIYAPRFR